jgi:hypothetical protein
MKAKSKPRVVTLEITCSEIRLERVNSSDRLFTVQVCNTSRPPNQMTEAIAAEEMISTIG